jgi:protein-S-isoprenylcysteine O-methyltransferase Ste14
LRRVGDVLFCAAAIEKKEVIMKKRSGEHPFGDAGQLILLGLFLGVWVADSFFLHKSTFLSDYLPLWIRLFMLGVAFIMALFLFKSGHVVVEHSERTEGVMLTGAFRYVRHPLYLASVLTYLGLTVSTMSIFSFVLLLGIFIFHNYIAGYEEKLLEMKFGEEYRRYKRRTGKWMPKINRKQ